MSALHTDSSSLIAALDTPSTPPQRPKTVQAQPVPDPRAARFGQLFARVFGEQARQNLAASPSTGPARSSSFDSDATNRPGQPPQASSTEETADVTDRSGTSVGALRAVQIGKGTQIITAGPPPADEDLMRFARDTDLDEASIAALMQGHAISQADALVTDERSALPSEEEGGQADAVVDAMAALMIPSPSWPLGLSAMGSAASMGQAFNMGSGALAGASHPAMAHGHAGQGATGQATSPVAGAATPPAAFAQAPGAAFSVSLSALPDASAAQSTATNTWMLSRAGEVQGIDHSLSQASEEVSSEASQQDSFSEEGLQLRLDFKDASVKDRLLRLLGPEALKAAQLSQPNGARLEAISLLESPLDMPELGLDGPTSSNTSSLSTMSGGSLLGGAGAGFGGQGHGQGTGGEGARPDANAQGGHARGLPQQVMQRFGELLSQRLIQQVSQGNWRVELDLEPGDLGSIRIELEMKKGEIEASIKASQAATRDLLQESLPRLRESLERAGMDVASLSVYQQDRRQPGGQSSSERQQSGSSGAEGQGVDEGESASVTAGPMRDDGRLDVWV